MACRDERKSAVPESPGGRSDAPIVIAAGCAQILLPGKGKRSIIALLRRASGECRLSQFTGSGIDTDWCADAAGAYWLLDEIALVQRYIN
jgi:hypothetical protein